MLKQISKVAVPYLMLMSYMVVKIYVYDGKTRKGQTRYLVGYMYMTGGQGRYVPDAG